jgi:hypothetical protein
MSRESVTVFLQGTWSSGGLCVFKCCPWHKLEEEQSTMSCCRPQA